MTLEERVTKKVFEDVAATFQRDVSEITLDTRLYDELAAKSLDFVSLMALFEEQFEVMIPFAELQRTSTVGEVVDLVVGLRKR